MIPVDALCSGTCKSVISDVVLINLYATECASQSYPNISHRKLQANIVLTELSHL